MSADAHDPVAARAASLEIAASHGLEILDSLPLTGPFEVDDLRTPLEVFERCLALDALVEVVHGGDARAIRQELERDDQLKALSQRERAYLDAAVAGDHDDHERIQVTWKVEVIYALTWALGGVDDLPATGIVDHGDQLAERIGPKGLTLRSAREIGAKLDLFYCLHWAVRERDLSGEPEPWPEAIDPGAVLERRSGLEWIVDPSVDDPDDIQLDT